MLDSLNIKKDNFSKFQFQVYQLCSQIPTGYVSTYKKIAQVLRSSPRAVGQALRNNPFSSDAVPCHRVIESNFFIGGYRGEWARIETAKLTAKQKKLAKERIFFTRKGYLQKGLRKDRIFVDFSLPNYWQSKQ